MNPIAESKKVYLDALAYILSTLGFDMVGKTSDQSKIADLANKFSPDLLVLDYDMASKLTTRTGQREPFVTETILGQI